MFKTIIAPVQAWLLSQGKCVGCRTALADGKKVKSEGDEDRIVCQKCGRIFLLNKKTGRFRRAPIS